MYLKILLDGINAEYARDHHEIGCIYHVDNDTVKYCWQSLRTPGKVDYIDTKRAKSMRLCLDYYSIGDLEKLAYTCAPGRFIKKIVPALKDAKVSELAEAYMSSFVYSVQVLNDPTVAYDTSMQKGTFYSCMNDRPQVSFYKANGVKAVVVMDDAGFILARALLWIDCEDEDGNKVSFVDRIYGPPSEAQAIRRWAKTNGYCYGAHGELTYPDGRYEDGVCLRYKLTDPYHGRYPYIDTMTNLDLRGGWAYSYEPGVHTDYADLTDGTLEGWFCEECGEFLGDLGRSRLGYFCEHCLDNFAYKIQGEWYRSRETTRCKCCGERIVKGNDCHACKGAYVESIS